MGIPGPTLVKNSFSSLVSIVAPLPCAVCFPRWPYTTTCGMKDKVAAIHAHKQGCSNALQWACCLSKGCNPSVPHRVHPTLQSVEWLVSPGIPRVWSGGKAGHPLLQGCSAILPTLGHSLNF